MKWLLLLFAFYFFALAVLPCADSVECDKFEKKEIVENPDHKHIFEMCSPFCICACCGVQLVFTAKINFILKSKLHPNVEDVKKSFYSSHILNNYLSEIWQPPKSVNV